MTIIFLFIYGNAFFVMLFYPAKIEDGPSYGTSKVKPNAVMQTYVHVECQQILALTEVLSSLPKELPHRD